MKIPINLTKSIINNISYSKHILLISTSLLILVGTAVAESAQLTAPNKKINIRSNTHFNNYDTIKLTVNIPAYPMIGQYRFIKIYDNNSDVLFLGEVPLDKVFSISVNKVKSAKKLTIEIFSENAANKTIVLVKNLKK